MGFMRLPGILFIGFALLGVSLGHPTAGETARSLSFNGPSRNMVIEIVNDLNYRLIGGEYYLDFGHKRFGLPPEIQPHSKALLAFDKASHAATGTTGIISYFVDDPRNPVRIVLTFSVPFNRISASNWFGLAIVEKNRAISKSLYNELYYDPGWKSLYSNERSRSFGYARDNRPVAVLSGPYKFSATMTDKGKSILTLTVGTPSGPMTTTTTNRTTPEDDYDDRNAF